MITYCDSSFLIALYCHETGTSEIAQKAAAKWNEPAVISPLTHLETVNAFSRKAFMKEITGEDCGRCIRGFEQDIADDIYQTTHFNQGAMFRDARALSLRYSATGGYRSLDLLHIAAAKHLGATTFLSFDSRLNVLAKLEKLKVLR